MSSTNLSLQRIGDFGKARDNSLLVWGAVCVP